MTDHDSTIEALLEQRQEQGYGTPSETVTEALSLIVAAGEHRQAGAS